MGGCGLDWLRIFPLEVLTVMAVEKLALLAAVCLTAMVASRRLVLLAVGYVEFERKCDESFDFWRLRLGGSGAHQFSA
jgi:hypothetical protein